MQVSKIIQDEISQKYEGVEKYVAHRSLIVYSKVIWCALSAVTGDLHQ